GGGRGVARRIANRPGDRRRCLLQSHASRDSTVESSHRLRGSARWRLAVRETFEFRSGRTRIAFGQRRSARARAFDLAAVREPGATREWRDRFQIGNVFARRDDVFSTYRRGAARSQRNESAFADQAFTRTAARTETAAQFTRLFVARRSEQSSAGSGRARETDPRLPDENRTPSGH